MRKNWVLNFWSEIFGGFSSERDPVEELKLYRQNYCGCIFSKYEGVKEAMETSYWAKIFLILVWCS